MRLKLPYAKGLPCSFGTLETVHGFSRKSLAHSKLSEYMHLCCFMKCRRSRGPSWSKVQYRFLKLIVSSQAKSLYEFWIYTVPVCHIIFHAWKIGNLNISILLSWFRTMSHIVTFSHSNHVPIRSPIEPCPQIAIEPCLIRTMSYHSVVHSHYLSFSYRFKVRDQHVQSMCDALQR